MNILFRRALVACVVVSSFMSACAMEVEREQDINIYLHNNTAFALQFIDPTGPRTVIPSGDSRIFTLNSEISQVPLILVLVLDPITQQYKAVKIFHVFIKYSLRKKLLGITIQDAGTGRSVAEGDILYSYDRPFQLVADIHLQGHELNNLSGLIKLKPAKAGKAEIVEE